jgi:hypothetical protein
MPHSIYKVNLYPKGKEHEPPALVWEGNAPNLVDAFAQTRHAYNSMIHNSATTTLLVEKRDYDAQSIHSYPVLFRRVHDDPRFDRQD